jgi:hypothetical protein
MFVWALNPKTAPQGTQLRALYVPRLLSEAACLYY